jgi:L-alanine-DL-glutamate epimerase-like enolase superfamily enzyme
MGDDITIEDGYAMLPDKAGLGCDLDEDLASKLSYRANDLPRLQYEDGTPSNW